MRLAPWCSGSCHSCGTWLWSAFYPATTFRHQRKSKSSIKKFISSIQAAGEIIHGKSSSTGSAPLYLCCHWHCVCVSVLWGRQLEQTKLQSVRERQKAGLPFLLQNFPRPAAEASSSWINAHHCSSSFRKHTHTNLEPPHANPSLNSSPTPLQPYLHLLPQWSLFVLTMDQLGFQLILLLFKRRKKRRHQQQTGGSGHSLNIVKSFDSLLQTPDLCGATSCCSRYSSKHMEILGPKFVGLNSSRFPFLPKHRISLFGKLMRTRCVWTCENHISLSKQRQQWGWVSI